MAVGSGLAAQLGVVAEVTYGTYVAPTRFFVGWLKGTPKFTPNRVQGGGLYAGEVGPRVERYVETYREGSGSFTLEVSRKQAGIIFQHLAGGAGTIVQQGGSAAWLQTHAAQADQFGRMLTIQAGVPQTDGQVRPYTFLGCKVQKATFTCGVGEILMVDVDVDFRDMTEAQSLVAASYPTGAVPFHFKEMAVKLGTFGAEASVTGVRKVTLTIDRTLKTDMQYAGSAGLKSQPVTIAPLSVSGSLETDFVDKTLFMDRFVANTSTSMVLEWVGPIIASTFNFTTRFKLPGTFFTDGPLEVDGPDVIGVTIPFESKLDATNGQCIAEYMSNDTSI